TAGQNAATASSAGHAGQRRARPGGRSNRRRNRDAARHRKSAGAARLRRGEVTMSTTLAIPRLAPELKPNFEIKVDLDDRAFLFPSGKSINQLSFLSDGKSIFVEAAYLFNQSRTAPRILSLDLEDAKELGHKLIEAVYYARPQL